jgi:glutathione S-transferase
MLKVYGVSKVNAVARGNTRDLRVLWALEEMQLPFELAGMDHPAHDLNTEAYRRLSPFEQIPSIDDDGLVLSESAAILVYLATKSGRLIGSRPDKSSSSEKQTSTAAAHARPAPADQAGMDSASASMLPEAG